jgi:hypothetical protein
LLYRFGDLTLASDVRFSQLPEASQGVAECILVTRRNSRPAPPDRPWNHHWRSAAGRVELSCSRDGDRYRLGVPNFATFAIEDDGRTITCRPEGDPPEDTLEHVVIDQVLPRILVHRGRLVLHAGAVETPSGAIAFVGESGAGKSTLCAAFARDGYRVLGDDGIVARTSDAGRFDAIATYPGLRLMPDPLRFLFGEGAGGTPVAHHTSKRRLRAGVTFDTPRGPLPLVAIYRLDIGPRIEVASVTGREAFVALLRACFQLHLDDAARSRDLFARIGAIVDAIPLRRVSYPRDLAILPDVRRALLDDASRRAPTTPASFAGYACS